MMTQSVSDYFTEVTQALSDSTTALGNKQAAATSAMATALSDLTTSNAQLRSDATNAYSQAVNDTNTAYSDARAAANTAWGDLQTAVASMTTVATTANSDAQTASADLLLNLDGQFATLATTMGQQDTAIADLRTETSTTIGTEFSQRAQQWYQGWLGQYENNVIQPLQWVGNLMMVVPGLQPVGMGITIGTGVVSLFVNYEQGDVLGIAFDILDIATSGIIGKMKGTFEFLRGADEVGNTMRTACRALEGGCFRGTTLTYRLAQDIALADEETEHLVMTVTPLATEENNEGGWMLACIVVGVGGFAWQRRRRRKLEETAERQAIDSVFGESPQDDALWT